MIISTKTIDMKNIIVFSFLLLTANTYGQTISNDSTIKVIYAEDLHKEKNPAWFINGNFVTNSIMTLNPQMIENINVIKTDSIIDGTKYYGQIYIKTKSEYNPKLITLTSLKEKYTNLENQPVVFMIDGNIVNGDYDKFVVDENYILQIIIDNIKNEKENIDLKIVKLLTKSEENIKKSNEIRIRGNEVTLNK